MDALWNNLTKGLNPGVNAFLLIIAVLFFIIYYIGKWKERFCTHDGRLDKVEKLTERVVKIETTVNLIYENTNKKSFVQSYSPISLTEIGKKTAEEIKAEEIFKRIYLKLLEEVNQKETKNAYDIQTVSFAVTRASLFSLLNEDELVRLKNEAFKQGTRLEDFTVIFGILLRNKILEERHIPINDVDVYDPSKKQL